MKSVETAMTLNRRQFVAGAGTAVGMAGLGTTVLADENVPVEIVTVYPVADVVILENTGDEDIDLGGYVMDWEYGSDPDQTDTFDSGTVIEAGQQLSVWTGFQSTQIDAVEADVQLDEYGNGRINAEEVDVVALLSPDGEVIDQTEDTVNGDRVYNADDYDDDGSEEQEIPGEAEVMDEEGEDPEYVEVTHDFPSQSIDEYACVIDVGVTNTSEDREVWVEVFVTTYDSDGDFIFSTDSGTVVLEPGDENDGEYHIECEEDGSYAVSVDVRHSTDYDPNGDDEPADDPDDGDDPDGDPDDTDDPADDPDDGDDADDGDDEEPVEEDEDCPDDEDEAEDEADEDEDCPEDEPEPEPEDEDDC